MWIAELVAGPLFLAGCFVFSKLSMRQIDANIASEWALYAGLFGLGASCVAHCSKARLSDYMIRHASVETLKECSKNIFQNVSVVGALVLAFSVQMLQADTSQWKTGQHIYVTFSILGVLFCLRCVYNSLWHTLSIEPLSSVNTTKYFLNSPSCLGQPSLELVIGMFWMCAAIVVWTGCTQEKPTLVFALVCMVGFWIASLHYVLKKGGFDPDNDKGEWNDKNNPKLGTSIKRLREEAFVQEQKERSKRQKKD